MNIRKAPALVLALALQVFPICRTACVNSAVAPTGFAIVMRWLAGSVAVLGSYHAVSGASAAVAGLVPINPVTHLQTGLVTTNATGTNGQIFAYRILVTNPGANPQQAFYEAAPLPAGLTINTNLGGDGSIIGTPTTSGVYFPVLLTAGNANYSNVVTLQVMITIAGSGSGTAPSITQQPKSLTVTNGASALFSVTATGTAPLKYQWLKAGSTLPGATTSSYMLSSVTTNDSGNYRVVITNSAGSVTSSVATLTVLSPPLILTAPQNLTVTNGATVSFTVQASGSLPLAYQWMFNGSAIAGATTSSFTITNAQSANQGDYSVVVSNLAAAVSSSAAHLTVQGVANPTLQLANWLSLNGSWSFDVSGPALTNFVIWSSTDLAHWTALTTNFSATGTVHFSGPNTSSAAEFYRATLSP